MSHTNQDPRQIIRAVAAELARVDIDQLKGDIAKLEAWPTNGGAPRPERLARDGEAVLREWNGVRAVINTIVTGGNSRAKASKMPELEKRPAPPAPDHEHDTRNDPASMYLYARMLARTCNPLGAMQVLVALLPRLESPGCLNRRRIRARTMAMLATLLRAFANGIRAIPERVSRIEDGDGRESYFIETWYSTRNDARPCACCGQPVNFGQVQVCDRDAALFGLEFLVLPDRVVCVPCALEHGIKISNQKEMDNFFKTLFHVPDAGESSLILSDLHERRLAVPALGDDRSRTIDAGDAPEAIPCGVIAARDPLGAMHVAFVPVECIDSFRGRENAATGEIIRAFSSLERGPRVDFHVHAFLDDATKLHLPDGITTISVPAFHDVLATPSLPAGTAVSDEDDTELLADLRPRSSTTSASRACPRCRQRGQPRRTPRASRTAPTHGS